MKEELLSFYEKKAHGLDDFYNAVQVFQSAAGHPDGSKLQMLTGDELKRRVAWTADEVREFEEAPDLVEQARELGDIIWFAVGSLVCMGVKPSGVLGPIIRANLSKINDDGVVIRRPSDGKVMKPEGWQPPDAGIEAEIKEMWGTDVYEKAAALAESIRRTSTTQETTVPRSL